MHSILIFLVVIVVICGLCLAFLRTQWLGVVVLVLAAVGLGAAASSPFGRDLLTLAGMATGRVADPDVGISDPDSPPDTDDRISATYQVTATVRVDGELRTASALQRVTVIDNMFPTLMPLNRADIEVLGEAVAVHIDDERYLVFSMAGRKVSYQGKVSKNNYDYTLAAPCLAKDDRMPDNVAGYAEIILPVDQACKLADERLPLLLAVDNGSVPTVIQYVDPRSPGSVFERDITLVSLTYKRVSQPLNYRLEDRIPQVLDGLPPPARGGSFRLSGVSEAIQIDQSDFLRSLPEQSQ